MSSILEHMCADVLQQTATQIKFPSTGMDTMPYWNLLPPKRPIKEVLTDIFAKVLEKGWVDSRSIHIFVYSRGETLFVNQGMEKGELML